MEGRKERGYEGRMMGRRGGSQRERKEGKGAKAAPASPGNLLAVQILWP